MVHKKALVGGAFQGAVPAFAQLILQGGRILAAVKVLAAGAVGLGLGVASDKLTTPTATDKQNNELLMTAAMRGDAADKLQSRFNNQQAQYEHQLRQQASGTRARSMRV